MMKQLVKYIGLLFLCLIFACQESKEFDFSKSNIRAITTLHSSAITRNSASISAKINTNNGSHIREVGVSFSKTTAPTINRGKFIGEFNNLSKTVFFSKLEGLEPATKYFTRPYATSDYGTAYGEEIVFVTLDAALAQLSTLSATNITQNTAITGGEITDNGGYPVTRRGVCYSSSSTSPTVNNDFVNSGNGHGNFVTQLSNLTPGITYHVRAFAETQKGVAYGQTVSFVTIKANSPGGISSAQISNIQMRAATVAGAIGSDGGAAITARGICYSTTSTSPTISNSTVQASTGGTGSFMVSLNDLQPNTTYYIRVYGTNSSGTGYGPVVQFKTLAPAIPSGISTYSVSNITMYQATGGGNVAIDGGGAITARGLCYSISNSLPAVENSILVPSGSGIGSFSATLMNLRPNTTYFVRAYATNASGTGYGPVVQFKTVAPAAPSGVSTYSLSNITANSALGGGSISSDGGSPVVTRGVCFSSATNLPSLTNSTIVYSGGGTGSFGANLTNLQLGTTYYVRSFATNAIGTTYGTTVSFTTLSNLRVGQTYQGGTIAYILQPGDAGYKAGEIHGLIVSNSIVQRVWGCQTISIATSSLIGTGNNNTIKIVNACSGSNAARYAYDLTSGGYSDWYLPSYMELQKIHVNKSTLSVPEYAYWSSTEDVTNSQTAYAVHFQKNYYINYIKNDLVYVLPVRSF